MGKNNKVVLILKYYKLFHIFLKLLYSNGYIDERYFDILTDKLIEKGIYIYQKRNEFIDNINK